MESAYINNIKYSIDLKGKDKGITIYQFCFKNNITIPCFCYHEKLSIAGNCRICVVDIIEKALIMNDRYETKEEYGHNNNKKDMLERLVIDPKRRLLEDYNITQLVKNVVDTNELKIVGKLPQGEIQKKLEGLIEKNTIQREKEVELQKIRSVRERRLRVILSCSIVLEDEMMIFTDTKRIKKMRESIVEFLLANHPLDCPICDQGGDVTYKI